MTDTDRIAQMAREAHNAFLRAGRSLPRPFSDPTHQAMWEAATAEVARLVAEDCAEVCDDKASKVYDHAKAPYLNMSQAIRARYSKEG